MKRSLVVMVFVWLHGPACLAQDLHRPWLAANAGSGESSAPSAAALTLPSTVRVRIAHTRSAVRLGSTGSYDFMSLSGGRVFSGQGSLTVRRTRHGLQIGA